MAYLPKIETTLGKVNLKRHKTLKALGRAVRALSEFGRKDGPFTQGETTLG